MSRIAVAGLCLLVSRGLLLSQANGDAAVRQVVARYLEVRNHPDAMKLKALFTADADQLVSSGEWRRGRESLVKGAMASSRKEAGNSSIQLDSVRFVTKDVAMADGDYATHTAGAAAGRKMRTTFVIKHEPDGWKIAAIRNMLPAPPATSAAGPKGAK